MPLEQLKSIVSPSLVANKVKQSNSIVTVMIVYTVVPAVSCECDSLQRFLRNILDIKKDFKALSSPLTKGPSVRLNPLLTVVFRDSILLSYIEQNNEFVYVWVYLPIPGHSSCYQ